MVSVADHLYSRDLLVVQPRLPGHGTNGKDFRASDHRQWWRAAVDAYLEAASWELPVMVTGLSMGGLLATLLAAQFPVTRLALLAPAFRATSPLVPLTPVLQFLVPPRRKGYSQVEEHQDPDRRFLAQEYWDWQWPRQTASLYALMRRARTALRGVTCPTLTVVSRDDSAVPWQVAHLVEKNLPSGNHRTVVLENGGHVLTRGEQEGEVAREVGEWFQ